MEKLRIKTILINTMLTIFALAISILLSEAIIRQVIPQNLSGSWRVRTDKGLLVNKSIGTAKHQLGERVVEYNFHEPHLRDTSISTGKMNGIKILTVGDSFTFGWLLGKKDTYVFHLQDYTDNEFGVGKFCYLNAAAGGWGAADYIAYIEDFGDLIKPDIILIFINTDDIGRSIKRNIYTLSGETGFELKRHILKSSFLKKIANSVPAYQWLLENSHLVQFVRNSMVRLIFHSKSNEKDMQKPTEILKKPTSVELNIARRQAIRLGQALFYHLKNWCQDQGVFLCVTTTGWHNMLDIQTSTEPTEAFMSTAKEFFEHNNIPFGDISPYLYHLVSKNQTDYIIHGDGHPNERGSKLIANKAWKLFVKKQLMASFK